MPPFPLCLSLSVYRPHTPSQCHPPPYQWQWAETQPVLAVQTLCKYVPSTVSALLPQGTVVVHGEDSCRRDTHIITWLLFVCSCITVLHFSPTLPSFSRLCTHRLSGDSQSDSASQSCGRCSSLDRTRRAETPATIWVSFRATFGHPRRRCNRCSVRCMVFLPSSVN